MTKTLSFPMFAVNVEIASLIVNTPNTLPDFRIIGNPSIEDVKTFFKIASASHIDAEDTSGSFNVERINMDGTQIARITARQYGRDGNPDAVMSLDFGMEDADLESLDGPDEFDDAAVAQSNWDQLANHLSDWFDGAGFFADFPETSKTDFLESDEDSKVEDVCEHSYEIKALYPTGGKLVQHLICSECHRHAARTLQEAAADDHVVNV